MRASVLVAPRGRPAFGGAWGVLALLVAVTAACHLADDPETHCPANTHVDTGRCIPDTDNGALMVITAASTGGACGSVVAPTSIKTKPDGTFRFRNDDKVDHVIRGADGQVWATLKPSTLSDYLALKKLGSWDFDIDTCSKAGVIVVSETP